jgi:endonuclease I
LNARISAVLLLLIGQPALDADPPPHYYDSAQGKSGADLRAALHTIIHNHHALPYSGSPHPNTADALGVLDQDPANTNDLIGIYSGYSIAGTNIGSASGTWNREHLWCQSYGTDSGPASTDLHHMRPEQANVNSARGNNYYDVSNPTASGYKSYTNAAAGLVWSRTSTTWEPPDSRKGDIARALLYMAVRYTGDAANEPLLTLTDATNLIASGSAYMGRYTTLLKWHFADPVSATERARNDGVYSYQGNRNPFVDRPEWVAAAFVPPPAIRSSGSNITLWWTNDYAPSMALEQTTNLMAGWGVVTNRPALTSTNTWSVTLPLEAGACYYHFRLQ